MTDDCEMNCIENMDCIPVEIVKEAEIAESLLIPQKSKDAYENNMKSFVPGEKQNALVRRMKQYCWHTFQSW
ncbi:hypothetical protein C0J52_06009 [Blattella germanica]|nr:hypothetical protein C0J52_06009 [Blattella germanica]